MPLCRSPDATSRKRTAWAAREGERSQAGGARGLRAGSAAGHGNVRHVEEIASEGRHERMADFTQFVRSNSINRH
jgi:hypothetical protein